MLPVAGTGEGVGSAGNGIVSTEDTLFIRYCVLVRQMESILKALSCKSYNVPLSKWLMQPPTYCSYCANKCVWHISTRRGQFMLSFGEQYVT
jgi:hypothetical protein